MQAQSIFFSSLKPLYLGQETGGASDSVQDLFGGVVAGSPQWIPLALVLFVVLIGLVSWNTLRMSASFGTQALSCSLKLFAIAILCLCLVKPMRRGERAIPQENLVAVLLDNSQSMQLKPPGSSVDRLEKQRQVVADDEPWKVRLLQDFDVRQFQFGRRLEKILDPSSLDASAPSSNLMASLDSLRQRFENRPLAAVFISSDGNVTDAEFRGFNAEEFPAPIYPILDDEESEFRDLCIDTVSVQQTDFETSPTKIQVQFHSSGLSGETATIQLIDLQTGELIEETQQTLEDSDFRGEVQFRFRPEQSGVTFYEVLAFTELDKEALLNPTADGIAESNEATLLNNAQLVSITRETGPYRILYLSGRPNWEFKFLRRSLQADAEVQLVGLIRIAKKEPKFSFRDRSVSSTNPLFAGLGKDEEDSAEQYDEPVLIRFGVKESEELSDGFPTSEEELFAYHAIILDDLETEFFTQDQMLLLRKFVSARVGGLLLLAGQESFSDNGLRDTPLGDMTPFYVSKTTEKPKGPYRIDLTREGMLQPWIRLSDTETDEQTQLRTRLIHNTLNLSGELKPGASILAVAETPDQVRIPALISQRFGRGRSAAWMIGDLWKSAMRRESTEDDASGQAWRQLARWLVNDSPRRVELGIESSDEPNGPIRLSTTVRDESYLPLDNAKVAIEVTPLGGETLRLGAEMDNDLPGVYHSEYWSADGAAFQAVAKVESIEGEQVGEAEIGWTQNIGAQEFKQLEVNVARLSELAEATGGKLIRRSELSQFAKNLPNQKMPISQNWLYPLWHSPWVMLMAMSCLCLEWTIRRVRGMA
ncbi:MAG: hypothetical protein VX694_10820 [Planctomycetota bacterium]|nr:hypothetical protein [Planctomycetota bacterium]